MQAERVGQGEVGERRGGRRMRGGEAGGLEKNVGLVIVFKCCRLVAYFTQYWAQSIPST